MSLTSVVLLSRLGKYGKIGDIIRVKSGFARNYLIPQKKALLATPQNRQYFDDMKEQLNIRHQELQEKARNIAQTITGKTFILQRQASPSGHLYGSVSSKDIFDLLAPNHPDIEKQHILLDRPIKELGSYVVPLSLYDGVDLAVTVDIIPEGMTS